MLIGRSAEVLHGGLSDPCNLKGIIMLGNSQYNVLRFIIVCESNSILQSKHICVVVLEIIYNNEPVLA